MGLGALERPTLAVVAAAGVTVASLSRLYCVLVLWPGGNGAFNFIASLPYSRRACCRRAASVLGAAHPLVPLQPADAQRNPLTHDANH